MKNTKQTQFLLSFRVGVLAFPSLRLRAHASNTQAMFLRRLLTVTAAVIFLPGRIFLPKVPSVL